MKQIMSVLMILMFLGSVIPLSEATLVANPGTIIGLLSEGQTQGYILDNGDRYTVAPTRVNSAGNKYADFNINGRAYNGLVEYQNRLRSDSIPGYDIGGNNEFTIITIFPQGSQTPARVQFAIAPKQGVRSNAPYVGNAQPRLATQPTAISIQARPVPTDTQAYPRTAMPSSGSPQPVIAQPVYSCESSCNEKYNACLQEQVTDAAYSRFVERSPQQCESSYKNCLSACTPQPTPPAEYPDCEARFRSCADYYGKDEQACKNVFYDCRSPCEERYNACAKYYGNEEDVCQKIISSCQKPVQSVCGNNVCESYEEKTCPSDCKGQKQQGHESCVVFDGDMGQQQTLVVDGQKFLLQYQGERGPLSEPLESKTRWHELLVYVNNNLYSIDNINHSPTPLKEHGFSVMGYISDFDQHNQARRADICITSLKSQQCGNQYCEKGEEWKTCPIDCKEPYVPPQPVPDCDSTCKDSYSYCINQAPFGVGQVWTEKLNDNSIRFGAKVVEMTRAGSSTGGPSLNVNVLVSLDGKEMKLAYDEKSAYYYSEPLREELTGQHKLSARISKAGLGSVGVDHVIDFSGKINEWTAPPAIGMFPYANEGKVYIIEKPTADYRAILEKQCSGVYNQCAQGCGVVQIQLYPAQCKDSCYKSYTQCTMLPSETTQIKLSTGSSDYQRLFNKRIALSIKEVQDSRCPPNADCIHAGNAVVTLFMSFAKADGNAESKEVTLFINKPTEITFNNQKYTFMLNEVVPMHNEGRTEYTVVFTIDRVSLTDDTDATVCHKGYDDCLNGCNQKPTPYPTIPPTVPPMPPAIVCDNSCYLESSNGESLSGKCIPYGIRLVEKDKPVYCGISGMLEKQKEAGTDAQNNYECLSNVASDGKCLDIQAQLSILQKLLKFFSSVFGSS